MADDETVPAPPARTGNSRSAPVIIAGAGVAGLTCAAELTRAGRRVLVLEASDGVGGRIRTDRREGYLLDRGFQVLLDAYPAYRRHVRDGDLRTAAFDAGAIIWDGVTRRRLANPLAHPESLLTDLVSPVFGLPDKLRLAALAARTRTARWQTVRDAAGADGSDETAADAIWDAGFGRRFMDHFARPFWGGITLDPWLSGSSGPLRFTLKMFLEGRAVLPDTGIQALPDLLASRLSFGSIRYNTPVVALVREQGRVTGVMSGGDGYEASTVVIATDPPTARRLTGDDRFPGDGQSVGCTTIYLRGRRDPGLGKTLLLDGSGRLSVNHVAPLSSVQPAYAPNGRFLVAAVTLGDAATEPDDGMLAERARDDVARMLGHLPADWEIIATVRVPYSQFAQPPGVWDSLPDTASGTPGLVYAGEATVDSSCNGAMTSGERAARHILDADDD